jgi:hypothetical protein
MQDMRCANDSFLGLSLIHINELNLSLPVQKKRPKSNALTHPVAYDPISKVKPSNLVRLVRLVLLVLLVLLHRALPAGHRQENREDMHINRLCIASLPKKKKTLIPDSVQSVL